MKTFKKVSQNRLCRDMKFMRMNNGFSIYKDRSNNNNLHIIDASSIVERKRSGECYFNWLGTITVFENNAEQVGDSVLGEIATDMFGDKFNVVEFKPPITREKLILFEAKNT